MSERARVPVVIQEEARMVEGKGAGRKKTPPDYDREDYGGGEARARSPLVCQCSCHEREGRKRSPMRGYSSPDRYDTYSRRNSSEYGDSREDGGKYTSENGGGKTYSKYGGSKSGKYGGGRNKMPAIDIKDTGVNKYSKGASNPSKYVTRNTGSGSSYMGATSASSNDSKKSRNKPPFRYTGRSLSADNPRSFSKAPSRNEYDYHHENFLTGPYTSEYQARYEMRMGQRYKVNNEDKSIHFIDPAGEHVLVPVNKQSENKPKPNLQRRNSDSDIPRNRMPSRNNMNDKLKPMEKTPDINKEVSEKMTAPPSPGNKSQPNLPPLDRAPKSRFPFRPPSRDLTTHTHPLGLNTPPPRRKSTLSPL